MCLPSPEVKKNFAYLHIFLERMHDGLRVRNIVSTLSGSSLTASQTTGLNWLTQPTPQTVEVGSSVSFTLLSRLLRKDTALRVGT